MFHFVPKVQGDEHGGGIFEETRVVEWTGIDRAHTRDHLRKFAHRAFCFGIISADERIAIDILLKRAQQFRTQSVKGRDHGKARRRQPRSLLCSRPVPQRYRA